MWAVPVTYYALFVAFVIINAKAYQCTDPNNPECLERSHQLTCLQKALGYFSTFTNLIACVIMALVVKSVWKLTHEGNVFQEHES